MPRLLAGLKKEEAPRQGGVSEGDRGEDIFPRLNFLLLYVPFCRKITSGWVYRYLQEVER